MAARGIRATAAVQTMLCKMIHCKENHTLSRHLIATGMNAFIIPVVSSSPPWNSISSTRLLMCERPPVGSGIKTSGKSACKASNAILKGVWSQWNEWSPLLHQVWCSHLDMAGFLTIRHGYASRNLIPHQRPPTTQGFYGHPGE